MFRIFGVVLIVLAIGLAVVPAFTDCQSQGKAITLANGKEIPMKCHWTGIAEIGVAVPMALGGIMMIRSRRKSELTNLNVMGIALGALAIAFPTVLIGVCQTPTMSCVTAMKPALIGLGSLAVGLSLVGIILTRRSNELA